MLYFISEEISIFHSFDDNKVCMWYCLGAHGASGLYTIPKVQRRDWIRGYSETG